MQKIYTSYFGALKAIPLQTYQPISIARWMPPALRTIPQYLPLAPTEEILSDYKSGKLSPAEYTQRYISAVLAKLTPHSVRKQLFSKAYGKDVILLCYEKKPSFCHRHIVNEWLKGDGEWGQQLENTLF